MKTLFVTFFILSNFLLNAQISIKENTSLYMGESSYYYEANKYDFGYLYTISLNDSARIGDTIFRNSTKNRFTLIANTNSKGKIKWFLSLKGSFLEKPIQYGNKVSQIIVFEDSVYRIGSTIINNPAKAKIYGIVSIDSNGNNISFTKIGNDFKSDPNSWLLLNCLSYNLSGNIIVSGYLRGKATLGDLTFQGDSIVLKYFAAEFNLNGTLMNYKELFTNHFEFKQFSRGIEYKDKLIFETSFDSLTIQNKTYTAFKYLDQYINDIALFVIDKNTLEVSNYYIMQDNTNNYLATGNGILCNDNGILWPINSEVQNIRLNDSVISIDNEHQIINFLLDLNTPVFKKYFYLNSETDGSIDLDVFDENRFIITFRYSGSYVTVNEDTLYIPSGTNTTAFVTVNSDYLSKLIFSVKGESFGARLTKFSESQLEMWVNYIYPNSSITAKTQTISRKNNFVHWHIQSTHYTLENFSSIQTLELNKFSIYPNPSNGLFTIQSTNKNEDLNSFDVLVYNANGQLVCTQNNANEIDLTGLSAGIYFIEIKKENQNIGMQMVSISPN